MKKFLLVLSIFFSSFLCADDNFLEYPVYTQEFEGKVKFERYKKSNITKLETSFSTRLESELVWVDAKTKISIINGDTLNDSFKVDLDRFFIGYRAYESDNAEFFMQIGRAKLESIFDSKLQFNSHFNGIHGYLSLGKIKINAAEHIINKTKNHFGTVAEISYADTLKLPVRFSYSINDWVSENDYVISQVTATAHVLNYIDKPVQVYGAFLRNHKLSSHSSGIYAGVSWGKVQEAHDWLLDVNYQYAGINAIPDFDFNGIGKGVQLKGEYGVTSHFTLQGKVGFAKSKRFEFSGTYKF